MWLRSTIEAMENPEHDDICEMGDNTFLESRDGDIPFCDIYEEGENDFWKLKDSFDVVDDFDTDEDSEAELEDKVIDDEPCSDQKMEFRPKDEPVETTVIDPKKRENSKRFDLVQHMYYLKNQMEIAE